jgi:amino acid transporter/nucleotide-binding universal stress UspA family protein
LPEQQPDSDGRFHAVAAAAGRSQAAPMLAGIETNRPRNLDAKRSAAILYGDWGTSKAYVIGLAFAAAGYSSFWLILAMCVLTAVVGVNYIFICNHYPDGGGVYASVRHRSEIISIVGAFLLIADYIVTAALSALSAFQYLGVPHPEKFAAAAIAVIGALNWFGPKHTGGLAFLVSIPTFMVVMLLGLFSIPHLPMALHHIAPLQGGLAANWPKFVSIVLALSGVEAVANSTGVMRLDKNSTLEKPSVSQTSTPAILWIMAEVVFFTAFLGLAMEALPHLHIITHDALDPTVDLRHPEVNAPGHADVRDYMLRYMGEHFVSHAFGPAAGHVMGVLVSIVFGVLLLSAVNTAVGALISTMYLMARDRELPVVFRRLNDFGVPTWGLVLSAAIPLTLVLLVSDLSALAELYAVGVVGAIATNLGACSTDRKLELKFWERAIMFATFLVMLVIEISLFVDKPSARVFAITVLAIGLILRALAREQAQRSAFAVVLVMLIGLFIDDVRAGVLAVTIMAGGLILRGLLGERSLKRQVQAAGLPGAPGGAGAEAARAKPEEPVLPVGDRESASGTPLLCAVRGIGKTLDFALEEAREGNRPLYLLFVREQPIITSEDRKRKWRDDSEARDIFGYAHDHADGAVILPGYAVSDSPADTIVDFAATIGASRLLLGAPARSGLVTLLRGNIIRQVSNALPEDIHLLICA